MRLVTVSRLNLPASPADSLPPRAGHPKCRNHWIKLLITRQQSVVLLEIGRALYPSAQNLNPAFAARAIVAWCMGNWREVESAIWHETKRAFGSAMPTDCIPLWRIAVKEDPKAVAEMEIWLGLRPSHRPDYLKAHVLLTWALAHWCRVYPRLLEGISKLPSCGELLPETDAAGAFLFRR